MQMSTLAAGVVASQCSEDWVAQLASEPTYQVVALYPQERSRNFKRRGKSSRKKTLLLSAQRRSEDGNNVVVAVQYYAHLQLHAAALARTFFSDGLAIHTEILASPFGDDAKCLASVRSGLIVRLNCHNHLSTSNSSSQNSKEPKSCFGL